MAVGQIESRQKLTQLLNWPRLEALEKAKIRIPTVKLKIPGKAFLKSESRTSVTFKL